MAKPPKGWQPAEVPAPPGFDLLVWNAKNLSVERARRDEWIAYADGVPVCDPWENWTRLQGVTHWRLPESPKI